MNRTSCNTTVYGEQCQSNTMLVPVSLAIIWCGSHGIRNIVSLDWMLQQEGGIVRVQQWISKLFTEILMQDWVFRNPSLEVRPIMECYSPKYSYMCTSYISYVIMSLSIYIYTEREREIDRERQRQRQRQRDRERKRENWHMFIYDHNHSLNI